MGVNADSMFIENYYGLLNSLSRENKIKLMAKLSNSIAKETVRKKNIVDKFYGAFKSEKTAEEIIDEIKNSRNFNRTIEAF